MSFLRLYMIKQQIFVRITDEVNILVVKAVVNVMNYT